MHKGLLTLWSGSILYGYKKGGIRLILYDCGVLAWPCKRYNLVMAIQSVRDAATEDFGQTTVEWTFEPESDGTTFVGITESGFTGDGDELLKQVADSTQGFTLVLAGLKAFLEHTIRLNLVADRFPKGIEEH